MFFYALAASRTFGASGLLAISAVFGSAEAAPKQLLNKTITASYNYTSTWRDPGGKTFNRQDSFTFAEYISSAGRIFERVSMGQKSQDFEPNNARNVQGETRGTHFEGNSLVQVTAYVSGATRVIMSFNPTFSSCTVDVVTAKDGSGTIRRKGPNGILYEMLSHSTSGHRCAIRDGNSFAN